MDPVQAYRIFGPPILEKEQKNADDAMYTSVMADPVLKEELLR